ncbi:MAG: glycosyltransferase family 4 protein, partial [Thermoproteota archaeon]|nr:glycosyltransferase family 4 protein [Thermoproteota archaeon]
LVKDIKAFEPDVVHVHNIHSLMPYFADKSAVKAKLLFTPHYIGGSLTTVRRLLFQIYKPFLSRVIDNTAKIICISDVERQMLLRDFAINESKITIIPNGVDEELSKISQKRNHEHNQILSVGRLDLVHKKTDKLIKAFKLVTNNSKIRLVLVGDGPDKAKILDLIRKLSLEERVIVRSNLTRDELLEEYSRASVFVTASENETYGIAVAEALTAGLKVVIPNTSGLALFVRGGYALGIDPPITPAKIAKGIMNCIEETKNNNSRSFRRYIPYSWDRVAEELERLYHQVSQ